MAKKATKATKPAKRSKAATKAKEKMTLGRIGLIMQRIEQTLTAGRATQDVAALGRILRTLDELAPIAQEGMSDEQRGHWATAVEEVRGLVG